MADDEKTSGKRRAKPLRGAIDGKPFTSDTQPSPEAKSDGWKKRRAERLLTQEILGLMTTGQNLRDYAKSLLSNAKKGNPKAIETINKGIEEDIVKIAHTDSEGNDAPLIILQRDPDCEPLKND